MKDSNDRDSGNVTRSDSISTNLLLCIRDHEPLAWQRLVQLYGPVVYGWCRSAGLSPEDATDVGQDVFGAVAAGISRFRRDRDDDTFRGWLWRIAHNKINDYWRCRHRGPVAVGGSDFQILLAQMAQQESSVSSIHDDSTPKLGLHRALEVVRANFEDKTWRAFWRVTMEQQSPADVAAELNMSRTAVYIAKSRVLGRLREEFADLMEEAGASHGTNPP